MEDDCPPRDRWRIGRQGLDDLGPTGGGGDASDEAVCYAGDCVGRGKGIKHLGEARQGPLGAGSGGQRQPRHIEPGLLNEQLCLVDFLGLRDLTTGWDDAEGVLLRGQGGGGHHSPRQRQRVSRLPCEWLCKAGGSNQNWSKKPHGQY